MCLREIYCDYSHSRAPPDIFTAIQYRSHVPLNLRRRKYSGGEGTETQLNVMLSAV